MRKSTIIKSAAAALALVAALGVAAAYAQDGGKEAGQQAGQQAAGKDSTAAKAEKKAGKTAKAAGTAHHHRRAEAGHRVAAPAAAPAQTFRIPAQPVLRDCVHVSFPQCSSRGGPNPLNDGEFPLHE